MPDGTASIFDYFYENPLSLHKKVVPLRRKMCFCITLTNLFNYKTMIVVPVKEGENIERALKKFKRKFEKTGVVKELRARQQFDKPSVKNRLKMERAIYVQQLQRVED